MSCFRTVSFHANYHQTENALSLLSREWALVMILVREDDTGRDFTKTRVQWPRAGSAESKGMSFLFTVLVREACPSTGDFKKCIILI